MLASHRRTLELVIYPHTSLATNLMSLKFEHFLKQLSREFAKLLAFIWQWLKLAFPFPASVVLHNSAAGCHFKGTKSLCCVG